MLCITAASNCNSAQNHSTVLPLNQSQSVHRSKTDGSCNNELKGDSELSLVSEPDTDIENRIEH